jgi:hydrogenase maturation protease
VSDGQAQLLVLGLGNVLCGDDGLGVAAVQELERRYEIPEGVRVLDGGTLGLSLLSWFDAAQDVILVDAIQADGPVGSFVRLEGAEVAPAVRSRLSVHQIGVADLLDALRLTDRTPRTMILLGLVPGTLELGLERTAQVEAALPLLVDETVTEVRRLGFELRRRRHDEIPTARHPLATSAGVGVL